MFVYSENLNWKIKLTCDLVYQSKIFGWKIDFLFVFHMRRVKDPIYPGLLQQNPAGSFPRSKAFSSLVPYFSQVLSKFKLISAKLLRYIY